MSVIRHCVGLYPLREGGTRLKKEKIDDLWVVHSYAHGGFGCTCLTYLLSRLYALLLISLDRPILVWLWACCCGSGQGYLEAGNKRQMTMSSANLQAPEKSATIIEL